MARKLAILIMVATVLSQTAMADHITMKNGDRLTGVIEKSDGKTLVIKTAYAGAVSVSRDVIEQISSDQPLYLTLSDGQTIIGKITSREEQVEVQTKDTNPILVARSSIQTIRSQAEQAAYQAEIDRYLNPGLLDLWSGFADLGLSFTRGNSHTTNFVMGANAVRATKRDKTSVYFTSLYASNKTDDISVTTANAVRGGGRYEINLTDRLFAFGFGDLEHDQLQRLDLRLVLGGGLGYYVKKTERTRFQLFGGGSVNKEYFDDDTRRTAGEALVGEELGVKLSDRVAFNQRGVLFPNLSEGGEFRVTFDSSLVTKLNRWLDWHVTLSDRYISNPIAEASKNDLLLSTGLRFSFKR